MGMSLEQKIHDFGFVSVITQQREAKAYERENSSTEDYVGKITAIFSPYLSTKISESKFMGLQENIKKIVSEIKSKELKK